MKPRIEQHSEHYVPGGGADHLTRVLDEVAPGLERVAAIIGARSRFEF